LNRSWLGRAKIDPSDVVISGSYTSWKLTYYVGKYGIDDGGSIRIARRSVSDEEIPQFTEPTSSGYTAITSSRNVKLDYFFSKRGHIRPFRCSLQIDVRDGSLHERDTITVLYGDTRRGSPGIRNQSFREEEHIFKVLVDPFGTGLFEEIECSPHIKIIGGPADNLDLVAPSGVEAGQRFDVVVRALDSYGNRSDSYRGIITFISPRIKEQYHFNAKDLGAHRFTLNLNTPGLHTIKVEDNNGFKAESNPIIVTDEAPKLDLYWGDMHGQTKQTVGTGTVDEYFTFLRDVAMMDFGGWQGNDFQITKNLWKEVKEKTKQYHESRKFVLFLGYEWSGLTPAGGDHNIYYLKDEEEIFRSDHWLITDKSDKSTDRYPIEALWKEFEGRTDVMAVSHVGGRHANLDYWNPERVPLIEVHSHHGTFEWFLEEALKRGNKVGFIAASDDHTCRPGLTRTSSSFTTSGGFTGVYARELTKEALWEAFWARRTFATTGQRIILEVKVDGFWMGDEYEAHHPPLINVKVHGTSPLHAVEVMRGTETIFRHPFAAPTKEQRLIKLEWMGARVKSRPKRVNWDGGLYIDKGRIVSFEEYSFDYLDQGIKKFTNQHLTWSSTTGGDSDGVILKIDASQEANISFYSNQVSIIFKPSEIGYDPQVVEVGPVNKKVKIQAITNQQLPQSLEFEVRDSEIKAGMNPYWVKVTQSDGSLAWSSPVYVEYTP
jgi:hypothetical protein